MSHGVVTGSPVRTARSAEDRKREIGELVCVFDPLTLDFLQSKSIRVDAGSVVLFDLYNCPEGVVFKLMKGIEPKISQEFMSKSACCSVPVQCVPMTQATFALDPRKSMVIDGEAFEVSNETDLLALALPGSYFIELVLNGVDYSALQAAGTWLFYQIFDNIDAIPKRALFGAGA